MTLKLYDHAYVRIDGNVFTTAKGFTYKIVGCGGGSSSYSSHSSPAADDAEEAAKKKGLVVKHPYVDQLFIDIDSERDFERYKSAIEIFKRFQPVLGISITPSASGLPHRHITVTLSRQISSFERIAFQAMLGSDIKRECLSYGRLTEGSLNPTVFFERPAGYVAPAQATGFNCARPGCNARNDYAQANQPDGTYVCFECRDL